MTALEAIIDDLRALPPGRREEAASYIQRLRERAQDDRNALLDATAGTLTGELGDSLAAAVDEGCEKVDSGGW